MQRDDIPAQTRLRTDAEEILAAAVRIRTGIPAAEPRPGQLALVRDLVDAHIRVGGTLNGVEGGRTVSEAPTGL